MLGPAPVLRDFNTPVVFGQNGQADEMRTRSHGEKVNSGRDKLPETGRGTLALSYLLRGEIKRFAVCKQRRAMSLPAVNSSSRGTQCPRCQITLRARCAWREVNNAGSWFSPNSQWRSVKGPGCVFFVHIFQLGKKKKSHCWIWREYLYTGCKDKAAKKRHSWLIFPNFSTVPNRRHRPITSAEWNGRHVSPAAAAAAFYWRPTI